MLDLRGASLNPAELYSVQSSSHQVVPVGCVAYWRCVLHVTGTTHLLEPAAQDILMNHVYFEDADSKSEQTACISIRIWHLAALLSYLEVLVLLSACVTNERYMDSLK